MTFFRYQAFLNDFLTGLSVSFVALSLGAAFGILSGIGAFSGMIASAIFPLVLSIFGGTRVQCSGPTGPMTTVFAVMVGVLMSQLAIVDLPMGQVLTAFMMLTGLFLILFGILRVGYLVRFIPQVVLSGFMNGVACLIWWSQAQRLFGLNGATLFEGSWSANLLLAFGSFLSALLCGAFIQSKKSHLWDLVPVVLVTLVFWTLIAWFFQLDVQLVHLETTFTSFFDLKDIVQSHIPVSIGSHVWQMLVPFAFKLSVVAYLDTLLTSLILDRMTKSTTFRGRELCAQGMATIASGLLGGLPGAQATERSVLMVKEGAKTRWANFWVGFFALVFLFVFKDTVQLIPQAVFSGILLKVGYDVFDWKALKHFWKRIFVVSGFERTRTVLVPFFIVMTTTFVTVVWDLAIAVLFSTILYWLLFRAAIVKDLAFLQEAEGISDEP